MVKDMTEGKPGRLILEFAIPLLMGNLFQQFYSLVDTAIVGKFLGVDQLAAVGSTGSINFLIIGFCMGICDLCSGAHDRDGASVQKYPAVDADTGKYH